MHAVSLRCDVSLIQMSLLEKWGDRLPLLLIDGHDYLVGSHVAELLKRETFNLYGSLKRRGIPIWHASDDLLRFLSSRGSVYVGTASVSLLRLIDISEFISAAMEEDARRTERRKGKKQKRISKEGWKELDLLMTALEEHNQNEQAVAAMEAPPSMILLKSAGKAVQITNKGSSVGGTC